MRRIAPISCALFATLALTVGACAHAGGDPRPRAANALESAQIHNVDLQWEQDGRFLILHGQVDSEADVARAGQVVEDAVGKQVQVINELEVRGATSGDSGNVQNPRN